MLFYRSRPEGELFDGRQEVHDHFKGKLVNAGSGQCVKNHFVTMNGDPVRMGECKVQGSSDLGLLQRSICQVIPEKDTDIFTLSWHEDLAAGDGTSNHAHNHCFDAEMDTTYGVKALAYWQCHGDFGNQLIKYLPNTQVNKTYVTIT